MFALMNWELYRSIKGMSNKNKHQSVLFTRMWEDCGRLPAVDGVCETSEIVKR